MKESDFAAFLRKLPELHIQLQAKRMDCGPDTWLAVHDLLLSLGRKQRLPDDPLDLAPFIGPILCSNPQQQREFQDLFKAWWTGQPQTQTVGVDSEGQVRRQTSERKTVRMDRRWRYLLAALSFALVLLAAFVVWRHPDPVVIDPTKAPSIEPPKSGGSTSPTEPATRIPIVDRAPPRRLPEPSTLPEEWQRRLEWIGQGLPWLPAAPILVWLIWHYRRRWVLSKGDPDSDSVAQRLRLRLPRPLFSGEDSLGALQRLRGGQWFPTRKLDMDATVEATARQAGYFMPRYLGRRSAPHYLMLVRSRHLHDQSAALADALIERFQEHGLSVEGFRFRDDPSWLIPWTRPRQAGCSLSRLGREWPDARLIVVSEGDVLFHPLTGRERPWLEQIKTWERRAWLGPGPMDAGMAGWLWERDFLVLPLTGASLDPLSHWLAGWTRSQPPQPASVPELRDLPRPMGLMPERWLDAVPPYGEDIPALLAELSDYLQAKGGLLFRAIAAYPQARWALTQALDYELFPDDEPAEHELRLGHLGRLPWVRYGHIPDYLREMLLEDLGRDERRRIRDAYGRLLALPAVQDGPGVLTLPIAAPGRRKLRRMLLDMLVRHPRPSSVDDPIFLNLLLGDRLSRLDFHLPRALARLLPGGRWRINPWPGLVALLLVVGLGQELAWVWESGAKDALVAFWKDRLYAENSRWPVVLRVGDGTEALAEFLEERLPTYRYSVRRDSAPNDFKTPRNRIVYPPGAENTAQRLAQHLRFAAYGADVLLQIDASIQDIQVDLLRSYQPLSVFNDALVNPVETQKTPESQESRSWRNRITASVSRTIRVIRIMFSTGNSCSSDDPPFECKFEQ